MIGTVPEFIEQCWKLKFLDRVTVDTETWYRPIEGHKIVMIFDSTIGQIDQTLIDHIYVNTDMPGGFCLFDGVVEFGVDDDEEFELELQRTEVVV